MFNPNKHRGLSMDMVEAHDGDLFIVVDPLSMPIAHATTEYMRAEQMRIRDTHLGVIIHLSRETIHKIHNGEIKEIVL